MKPARQGRSPKTLTVLFFILVASFTNTEKYFLYSLFPTLSLSKAGLRDCKSLRLLGSKCACIDINMPNYCSRSKKIGSFFDAHRSDLTGALEEMPKAITNGKNPIYRKNVTFGIKGGTYLLFLMIGLPWKEAVKRVEYKLILEFLLYSTLSSNKPLLCLILSSAKQGVFRYKGNYPFSERLDFIKKTAGPFRRAGRVH